MASKNELTVRALIDAFNRHDLDVAASAYADDCVLVDHARQQILNGRQAAKEYMAGWTTAFSDAKIDEPRLVDGGDQVVLQFVGRGVNDGPLGALAATGNHVAVPYCEVMTFNSAGKIIRDEAYYDQLGMLVQLGHAPVGWPAGRATPIG